MKQLAIIGAGPGDEKHLTLEARERIMGADLVITTDRLYEALSHLNPNMQHKPLADVHSAVLAADACHTVVVLVSGDSGFYSLGKNLAALLGGATANCDRDVQFFSGISSMQYLCATLGVPHDDAKIISLHGRKGNIVPFVSYNPKVFALTGGTVKAHDVIARLVAADLGKTMVAVGADLGAPRERLVTGRAEELAGQTFPDLACMLITNEHSRNPRERIPDSAFTRGKTPMTKETIRTLAIAALGIQPGDTVFDIGAGTGSVSICMARKAFEGTVYALERDHEALALSARNRLALGAFNLTLIRAEAPDGLASLPAPDKVFIGGSGGRLREIMQTLFAANTALRMVVTSITLESLHHAVEGFIAHGCEPEITCINAAVARKIGSYHMMQAHNPVYIISGGRNGV